MPTAVLDSNVLIASRNGDADNYEVSSAIVDGIDRGVLPKARVTNHVVAEVLNLLHGRHSHELAVDTYERLERGVSFQIDRETKDDFERGVELFYTYSSLAFVDALLAAYMQRRNIEYIYSFDDGFDALDSVTRLQTDANPFGW